MEIFLVLGATLLAGGLGMWFGYQAGLSDGFLAGLNVRRHNDRI